MAILLYYLVLKPLSLLPNRVLYGLSDLLAFMIYHGKLYRRQVVIQQLTDSFPDKSPTEIQQIAKKFYAHFCDLLVESLMIFSISKAEAINRCRVADAGIFEKLHAAGRNVIVVGGHYNNWEMFAVAFAAQIPHQAVALYKPLSNKRFDRLMQESRSKYGLGLYPKKQAGQIFRGGDGKLFAAVFAADQNPGPSKNVLWLHFLNQETSVVMGAEKYAREYDCAVVFGTLLKVKRGHYEVHFQLITENPAADPPGSITAQHVSLLEADIVRQPEFWLWTHRRWKKKRTPEQPLYTLEGA